MSVNMARVFILVLVVVYILASLMFLIPMLGFGYPAVSMSIGYAGYLLLKGYRREMQTPPSPDAAVITYLKERRYKTLVVLAFLLWAVAAFVQSPQFADIWPKLDCVRVHTVGECAAFFKGQGLFGGR